ncbi:MAG: CAP domain-containing protein, partial [Planctomycetales bacterium]|nr:CAP domain-containing protein [Planctomycetales bacterium]
LVRPPPPPIPKAERDLLEILEGIRRRAFAGRGISPDPEPLAVERSLAEGARLHALYLVRHRAQATTWPEIHEEYPDREGFTVEGAWSGSHSVIAPGVANWREAVDNWMGTFYHRLPLLDPGLLRVGGALERGIAVLDAQSLVRPVPSGWTVFWPPDGATGVPKGFRPEIPEPVPGADPNSLGYPVTLQVHRGTLGDPANVTMTLSRGSEEVPCFFSTPSQPGNPAFVPPAAYCLIPKQPLSGNVTYTVEAQVQGAGPIRWRFTTAP